MFLRMALFLEVRSFILSSRRGFEGGGFGLGRGTCKNSWTLFAPMFLPLLISCVDFIDALFLFWIINAGVMLVVYQVIVALI